MRGRKTKQVMNYEDAAAKARKHMAAVAAAGLILWAAYAALESDRGSAVIIDKDNGICLVRPAPGSGPGHLALTAKVTGEYGTVEEKVYITLQEYDDNRMNENKSYYEEETGQAVKDRDYIAYEIRSIASEVNSDLNEKRVELPSSLESGEKIEWEHTEEKGAEALIIPIMTMASIFAVYRNRFTAIKKQKREDRESVIRRLPEFVNRLVLMLNAGLVLNSAFERSVKGCLDPRMENDDYFSRKMKEIYVSSKEANVSFNQGLRKLARESGVRELIRISNIINDNISKGVELTDKLQAESSLLWTYRKKRCEEKGKLAETRLTLPLVIFLMVLVVITVAPALMEL